MRRSCSGRPKLSPSTPVARMGWAGKVAGKGKGANSRRRQQGADQVPQGKGKAASTGKGRDEPGARDKSDNMCWVYAKGRCTWGDQCWFSHEATATSKKTKDSRGDKVMIAKIASKLEE